MKVAITSIPKSGTHLLATVVKNIFGEYAATVHKNIDIETKYAKKTLSRKVVSGHMRIEAITSPQYSPFFMDRKIAVLVRDPRDICNSMVHYLETSHKEDHKAFYMAISDLDHEEKIRMVARGIRLDGQKFSVPSIDKACSGFLEIAENLPDSTIFRYEEFFDDGIVERLSDFFEVPKDLARSAVSSSLGANTRTKREGKKQQWRQNFSQELKDFFDENFGSTIRYLGY